MPNKTLRYYLNTLILKTAAYTCAVLEKLGVLKGYKNKNRQKFREIFERDFSNSITREEAKPTDLYLTYCHFFKPDDLGKSLLCDTDDVAMCRYDVKPPSHNPLTAAHFALIAYNHHRQTGDTGSLDVFWKQVFFLEKYGTAKGGILWFFYQKDNPRFGLKAPWASGLTQAVVMSVFIRAAALGDSGRFTRLVEMIYPSLFVPVKDGGVFRKLENGDPWIEEYAAKKPDMTLNGFIFCLVGLYEYYHFSNRKPETETQLHGLLRAFFNHFHLFVFGKYTKYHLGSPVFHNIEYQGIYPLIFLHLYRLSGKEAFRELANFYEKNTSWAAFNEYYRLPCVGDELIKPFFRDE